MENTYIIGDYSFEDGSEFVIRNTRVDAEVLRLGVGGVVGVKSTMKPKSNMGSINLHRRVKSRKSSAAYKIERLQNGAVLSGKFVGIGNMWRLEICVGDKGLHMSLTADGFDEIYLKFAVSHDEGFYGFGEQYSNLDMSGKAFTLMTTEQGIGRGAFPITQLANLAFSGSGGTEFTTYAPMPVFITNKKRAFAFEQTSIYHVDAKKSDESVFSIGVHGDELSGNIFSGSNPLELIEAHTAVTGRLKPLPEFAYGTILGLRGGRKAVDEIYDKCIAHGAKVDAIWIEDWEGKRGKNGGPPLWWRWLPDESIYPNFKNWADELKSNGTALMGYANPFLSVSEDNPLYLEGKGKYFIKKPDGSDYVSWFYTGKDYKYVCVDLSNPEAYGWLKEKMRTGMIGNGLSGWMADYGEYIPLDGVAYDENIINVHCELPVLWAKLNRELIEECGKEGEVLAFHRSAGAGSNKYACAYWAGDQNPTFDKYDGLSSAICGLITSGISGMSINHTDIGGFTTIITPIYKLVRPKEVMLRWLEFAAFTPIFRTHDGNFTNPDNYQFYYDDEGLNFYAKMSVLHKRLGFYYRALEKEACEKGYPMIRAMFLQFPDDPECYRQKYQYMLGEDLLVAPVRESGVTKRRAYLPYGEWINPYSGTTDEGGKYLTLDAELGKPPVLVRKGSGFEKELIEAISPKLGA